MKSSSELTRWLTPGIGIKRWLLLFLAGSALIIISVAYGLLASGIIDAPTPSSGVWARVLVAAGAGGVLIVVATANLSRTILAPYRRHRQGPLIDVVTTYNRRQRGMKVVAIGGGTGLPGVLRGLKSHTSNITAIVTVADDGGSSGRLRRDLGVLPPGDLRNNIAALADDESLMTRLFQYRFEDGDLGGHAFGNLFITALSGVAGGVEEALVETARVLNIQGRVLPATLDDVNLVADVRQRGTSEIVTIEGESRITKAGGRIEEIRLSPADIRAFPDSVQAIYDAEIVVIGPGSLYTSLLPNLLVPEIREALRGSPAFKIYVCNVATQPGETEGFTVADHVMALEQHVGRGLFHTILSNNAYPMENAGENTYYVLPAPDHHEVLQRYGLHATDLTDFERPWRHDPRKLGSAILAISQAEKTGTTGARIEADVV